MLSNRWVTIAAIAVACSWIHSAEGTVVDSSLKTLTEQYWTWRLEIWPEFATTTGVHTYDDQLESFQYSVFGERKAKCEEFLRRLTAISRDPLNKEDKRTYDLLKLELQTYINGSQWVDYGNLNPFSLMEGLHRKSGWNGLDFSTKEGFENQLKRMAAYPGQLLQAMDLARKAIALKRTHHNKSVEIVLDQFETVHGAGLLDPLQSPFYKPFNKSLDDLQGVTAAEKDAMRVRAKDIIKNNITMALNDFKAFFQNEYIPNTRQGFGVGSWPNGQNYYKAALKWYLTVDLTPKEVHDKGLQEVKRIKGVMEQVMKDLGFNGTLLDFFVHLKTHKDFYNSTTGDQIIEAYRNIIYNKIDPKLPMVFKNVDIPAEKCRVEASQFDGATGIYNGGTFYANVFFPEQKASFNRMALSCHEANPGHHLQISIAKTKSLPEFRARAEDRRYYIAPVGFRGLTSYGEGWALYAEYLGEEMGLYEDKYDLFGRYSSEIFRACRLVIDTGIHAFGWTWQQSVDYLSNHTTLGQNQIEKEVARYMGMPGQACAYKIGEIKIKEMRSKAEKELGSKFNVKDFHSMILNNGRVPMDILEQFTNEWIKDIKEKPTDKPVSGSVRAGASLRTVLIVIAILTLMIFP